MGKKRALYRKTTRQSEKLLSFDPENHEIDSSKLPSNHDVLTLLRNKTTLFPNSSVKQKANYVYDEIIQLWQKAKIPVESKQNSIHKLQNLYETSRSLNKSSKRVSVIEKTTQFADNLDNLFDIAHHNAFHLIKDSSIQEFLRNQRKKGRPGTIPSDDEHAQRAKSVKKQKTTDTEEVATKLSDESTENSSGNTVHDSSSERVSEFLLEKKEKISFIDKRIVSALDKCKVSDRNAMHIITAVAAALGHDVDSLIISRNTLQRVRKEIRSKVARKVKQKILVSVKHFLNII